MQVLDVENKGYLEEDVFTRFMTTMGEKLSADEVKLENRNSRQ
jgi:Ca2+-binding EF-hand superfamily protein